MGIAGSWPDFASRAAQDSRPQGRLLGTIPFSAASDAPPLNRLLGSGLDARLFTDLSTVEGGHPITPTDRFFVRTAYPATLDPKRPWRVEMTGRVRHPRTFG